MLKQKYKSWLKAQIYNSEKQAEAWGIRGNKTEKGYHLALQEAYEKALRKFEECEIL